MTHIKPTLLLAGVLLLPAILLAQTDTLSTKLLKELTIQDKGNLPFTFYQSSKLATTEEILGRMEGVNLIRRGPYGMEPTLRHYNAGQINLSIDGMRLYGACTDKMDPTSVYVEPINLEGISAAHGAHGNFQGSSIGGNINLKLKGPNTSAPNGCSLFQAITNPTTTVL
jgi:iron complex outermembrane receptor protein